MSQLTPTGLPQNHTINPDYEVTPAEARDGLANKSLTIIDVRGADELAIVSIPGAIHIPTSELTTRIDEIHELAEAAGPDGIAVLCHHGVRSLQATQVLRSNDILKTMSVAGGIDAWAAHLDSELPRY